MYVSVLVKKQAFDPQGRQIVVTLTANAAHLTVLKSCQQSIDN